MDEYINREDALKCLEYNTIQKPSANDVVSATLRVAREKVELHVQCVRGVHRDVCVRVKLYVQAPIFQRNGEHTVIELCRKAVTIVQLPMVSRVQLQRRFNRCVRLFHQSLFIHLKSPSSSPH